MIEDNEMPLWQQKHQAATKRRRLVGRRQTSEEALVRLYRWLKEAPDMGLPTWKARRILDYVDTRFVSKDKVDF